MVGDQSADSAAAATLDGLAKMKGSFRTTMGKSERRQRMARPIITSENRVGNNTPAAPAAAAAAATLAAAAPAVAQNQQQQQQQHQQHQHRHQHHDRNFVTI